MASRGDPAADTAEARKEELDALEYFLDLLKDACLDSFAAEDRQRITEAMQTARRWLSQHPDASAAQLKEKRREFTDTAGQVVGRYGIADKCRELQQSLQPERAAMRNLEAPEKDRLTQTAAATLAWVQENAGADCDALLAKYRAFGEAVNPVLAEEAVRSGGATGKLYTGRDGVQRFVPDERTSEPPKLLVDSERNIAVVEMDELASDEDLRNILDTLAALTAKASKADINAIVLNVKGTAASPMMIGQMLRSGAFIVGLRSCVSAVVGCVSGRVVGPGWALLLGADYRVASPGAELFLPVTTAPDCLQHLVGPAVAAHLCMDSGTMSVQDALGMSILHEVHPDEAQAMRAAFEAAARIAGFARNSVRETMMVLAPGAAEFVNAIQENPEFLYIPFESTEGREKTGVRAVVASA